MAHILVIDDESWAREAFKAMLKSVNHKVQDAENGQEGLDLYRTNPFDLVVTDILMPGMGGLEVIAEIRKIDPKARIIAVTAHVEDYLLKTWESQVDHTLIKPVNMKELIDTINRILDLKP